MGVPLFTLDDRSNKRLQRLQKINKRVCYFVNVYWET